MSGAAFDKGWQLAAPSGVLVLSDGTPLYGQGFGVEGELAAEVCFNTAMSGYQETLSDPSYAEQIVTFTFPHIGNIGANHADVETSNMARPMAARGLIIREAITPPSNYRAQTHFADWVQARGLIGLSGVDTRAITRKIRDGGMFNAVLAYRQDGKFDIAALAEKARQFSGLAGADLAKTVTTEKPYDWHSARWQWGKGFAKAKPKKTAPHVVALDFGCKVNILRCLTDAGCRVSVMRGDSTADAVLAQRPDGVFLSNGPGDPAATAAYAAAEIGKLVAQGIPIFGICLGHQMLALALGARTEKMPQGHHGVNHPIKDLASGKVEITSMNHGFTVARDSLPANIIETHISLFDGTNCGIALKDKPVFSVQYHPEASPGPQDSTALFTRFADMMTERA